MIFKDEKFHDMLLDTILEDIEDQISDYPNYNEDNQYDIDYPSDETIEMWAKHFDISPDRVCYPNISQYYLPCIENDDYSGLEEDEEIALRNWLKKYHYCAPLTCLNGEYPESSFSRCDITGLQSDCVPVVAFKR